MESNYFCSTVQFCATDTLMEYFPFYAIIILLRDYNLKMKILNQLFCIFKHTAMVAHLHFTHVLNQDLRHEVTNQSLALKAEQLCLSTCSYSVNLSTESCLLYLTMRHAATLVHSAPVRSSGCEKGWQGLKVRRISALTGMSSADTGFKRPR